MRALNEDKTSVVTSSCDCLIDAVAAVDVSRNAPAVDWKQMRDDIDELVDQEVSPKACSNATTRYTVVMGSGSPRSIRFDEHVGERLTSYVASRPGWSGSSAANRFVDEALRMEDHPGVIFRHGPTGRRAVLIGGPDVREVIRSVKSARASEPDLDADHVVSLVATNTDVPARLIDTAIRYWAAYPDEIDVWIGEVESFEEQALLAWERRQDLLAR